MNWYNDKETVWDDLLKRATRNIKSKWNTGANGNRLQCICQRH